ncbi:hypothetical protein [Thermococcus sp.]
MNSQKGLELTSEQINKIREYVQTNLKSFYFYPNTNLKYRIEKDGRIVCFSPLTGRISVLNPTMAFIYLCLKETPGLEFYKIVENVVENFNAESQRIEKEIQNAIIWLFVNGYINIKNDNTQISFIQIVQKYLGG